MLYQLTEIRDHVGFLPNALANGQMSPLSRRVLQLHTALAVETPEAVTSAGLERLVGDLADLSDLLSESYLR